MCSLQDSGEATSYVLSELRYDRLCPFHRAIMNILYSIQRELRKSWRLFSESDDRVFFSRLSFLLFFLRGKIVKVLFGLRSTRGLQSSLNICVCVIINLSHLWVERFPSVWLEVEHFTSKQIDWSSRVGMPRIRLLFYPTTLFMFLSWCYLFADACVFFYSWLSVRL